MGNKNGYKYQEISSQELAMLKVKTGFSEEEIRDWHVGFHEDCPDDKLTKEIFIAIFKKFYLRGDRAVAFCEYVFDMVKEMEHARGEKKEIHTISFEQFLLVLASKTQSDDVDKRLRIAFDMYDVSGNGKLDQNELANLILAMYNLVGVTERKGDNDPKIRAAAIIKKFDKDNDGKLSKTEFIDECNNDKQLMHILFPKS